MILPAAARAIRKPREQAEGPPAHGRASPPGLPPRRGRCSHKVPRLGEGPRTTGERDSRDPSHFYRVSRDKPAFHPRKGPTHAPGKTPPGRERPGPQNCHPHRGLTPFRGDWREGSTNQLKITGWSGGMRRAPPPRTPGSVLACSWPVETSDTSVRFWKMRRFCRTSRVIFGYFTLVIPGISGEGLRGAQIFSSESFPAGETRAHLLDCTRRALADMVRVPYIMK